MKMILSVISENKNLDIDLLINYLLFGNKMLEGGNKYVQQTIYEFFLNNPKSEMLFYQFNLIIKRQIIYLETKSKIAKGEKILTIDSTDEEQQKQDVEILNNVLQFLQLSVEGHYHDLQKYWHF